MMSSKLLNQTLAQEAQASSHTVGLLQRKCACGTHTIAGQECEECGKNRVQRFAVNEEAPAKKGASVQEALRTSGQPLDAKTRGFMESRFAHDFSRVRVHTDSTAAESARGVNALAYTVGQDIVFAAGKYAPETSTGKRLLAHELTHTIQQSEAGSRDPALLESTAAEHEAERNSDHVASGMTTRVETRTASRAVQKADDNPLDEKAKKIIEAAKDTTKAIDQRAVDAVNSIVKTYYDPALVEKVVYEEKESGLSTTYTGKGKDIKGQITVGKYFIETFERHFARKVLQVGHELQHVEQQRAGMSGGQNKNKREFLAHHWEATAPEKAGTGRMSHSSRVEHIDEALKNYYCMSAEDQKTYVDKKDELLTLRATEETASHQPHTEPPTSCATKK